MRDAYARDELVAAWFRMTGRVQGVGMRAHLQANANRLGIVGWVRNDDDGSVIGRVEGPSYGVRKFLEQLRPGPRGAQVQDVEVDEEMPKRDPAVTTFEIRR